MKIIHHRVNNFKKLNEIPKSDGVELDIRYHNNELILCHDPFRHHEVENESFKDFLQKWDHEGPMILNVKTEGVEEECIKLVKKYGVKDWFFLDLSMPYFVKYAQMSKNCERKDFVNSNLAVRFSDFEPIEYALSFSKSASWVWVDCFSGELASSKNLLKLKEAGFKVCLVSPELQNYTKERVYSFAKQCKGLSIDAVCTKYSTIWLEA